MSTGSTSTVGPSECLCNERSPCKWHGQRRITQKITKIRFFARENCYIHTHRFCAKRNDWTMSNWLRSAPVTRTRTHTHTHTNKHRATIKWKWLCERRTEIKRRSIADEMQQWTKLAARAVISEKQQNCVWLERASTYLTQATAETNRADYNQSTAKLPPSIEFMLSCLGCRVLNFPSARAPAVCALPKWLIRYERGEWVSERARERETELRTYSDMPVQGLQPNASGEQQRKMILCSARICVCIVHKYENI